MHMDEKNKTSKNISKFQIMGTRKLMFGYSLEDFFHFDLGFVVLYVINTSTPEHTHTHTQTLFGD